MSTFAWSYKSNLSGVKPPKENVGKIEEWQRKRGAEQEAALAAKFSVSSAKKPKVNIAAKLYVGNLHWETTETELAHYFSVFGDLDDVKIIKDHTTGHSRGFAFIVFSKVSDAQEAKRWCSFNYPMLRGRDIKVTSAERRLPKPRPPGAVHASTGSFPAAPKDINSTLFWEFKWTQDADAETFGPYETSVMLQWVKQGYFEAGCWVRQVDVSRLRGSTQPCETPPEEQDVPCAADTQEEDTKKTVTLISYSDSSDSEDDEGVKTDQDRNGQRQDSTEPGRGDEEKVGSKSDLDSENSDQGTIEMHKGECLGKNKDNGSDLAQDRQCQTAENQPTQTHEHADEPSACDRGDEVDFTKEGQENPKDSVQGVSTSDSQTQNELINTGREGLPADTGDAQQGTVHQEEQDLNDDSDGDDDDDDDDDERGNDQQSSLLTDFVHVSEINFAMFP